MPLEVKPHRACGEDEIVTPPGTNRSQFQQKAAMVHAMMIICFNGSKITSQQLATVESYAKSLPEFYGMDFQPYYEEAKKLASSAAGDTERAIDLLSIIESEELRTKAFYCCLELSLSNADAKATAQDEVVLSAIQSSLGVSAQTASQLRESIAVKYAHTT
ncbi:hypothetical protein ACQEV2_42650 [Streptomyces sp. CA-251387]|uniref:hypothetical protein n=1 Tax=Streptomyces sp. CA-251387 TaxID=3240064 RepID=UPI003D8ACCB2